MIRSSFLAIALAGLAPCQSALVFDAATQSVYVTGLTPRTLLAIREQSSRLASLSRVFGVFFEDSTTAMLGDYTVDRATLRFNPRFPLVPGRLHHAILYLRELSILSGEPPTTTGTTQRLSFRVEAPRRSPATRVTSVYPSGDKVPANLLRLYIHFSQPMRRRGIQPFIRLVGKRGIPVEHPFLDMEDGLWDPDARRLTLFFDPGRIKRGLALHDTMGAPLRSGERYRLVISRDAKDAEGMPLAEEFRKEFRVVGEDRSAPDPSTWVITAPRAGGCEPLTVDSGKPLDEPLFARLVWAEDSRGLPVRGDAVVEQSGTRWRFVPADPWRPGDYVLHVGADLEDVAGNRPGRLFDEPANLNGRRKEADGDLLRFRVRP